MTWRHPLPPVIRIPSEDIAECEQGAERLQAAADELAARRATRPSGNVVPLHSNIKAAPEPASPAPHGPTEVPVERIDRT